MEDIKLYLEWLKVCEFRFTSSAPNHCISSASRSSWSPIDNYPYVWIHLGNVWSYIRPGSPRRCSIDRLASRYLHHTHLFVIEQTKSILNQSIRNSNLFLMYLIVCLENSSFLSFSGAYRIMAGYSSMVASLSICSWRTPCGRLDCIESIALFRLIRLQAYFRSSRDSESLQTQRHRWRNSIIWSNNSPSNAIALQEKFPSAWQRFAGIRRRLNQTSKRAGQLSVCHSRPVNWSFVSFL